MRKLLPLAVALLVIVSSAVVKAKEEKLAVKDVPKSVTDTVKKRFPKAELTEAAKEEEKGKTFYEVTFKENGKNVDVSLTPDGKITLIEKQIAVADLPKAVSGGVDKKYPKATYKLAEEVTVVEDGKEKLGYYEVKIVTTDDKKIEIEVTPDGKIKQEEDKSKGDEDDDEK